MTTPQSGIIPDANTDALFLVLTIKDDQSSLSTIRKACCRVPELTTAVAGQYPEAELTSTISIGSHGWNKLYGSTKPVKLAPFKAVEDGKRIAPGTPGDLFLHIRSNRKDVNIILLQTILNKFGDTVDIEHEIAGFRYLDRRDLTGFVDGTENPQGDDRAAVAIVGDEDAPFAGGTYIQTQKYIHQLEKWHHIEVSEQEKVIGRTKFDNIEFGDDEKASTAHIKRANIKDAEGAGMEILRHSMPFASARESGLYFVSYCRTPEHFDLMLEAMMKADQHGHYDHLMNFSNAVTGCAFFAPSVEFLTQY